ncbi:TetR family transcriptional regulator [Porphyromonas gingivalis SJD12]|uniref:TetR/AcrR family transcriptional regulator n=1 Tax=Porphyromonas gingivalis TaxID=837 RepID=UPI000B50D7A0|nr:TetR/AcrR family transcriptional regulator [Porphyromonas gingivalis]OWR83188.1 TetR family transcriptional regulator [Porphyromonas gingivalis SJD12]
MSTKNTKELVLLEAFKLFSEKPYDKVTYTNLQENTGLSRGSVLHHTKSKSALFATVLSEFILASSIPERSFENGESLKGFIQRFIENCRIEQKTLQKRGIENINKSMLNLCSQTFYYCPIMAERYAEWMKNQQRTWVKIIRIAMDRKEIRSDVDVEMIASLFHNLYLGFSFSGSTERGGYDLNFLEKEFGFIYSFLLKD